MKKVTIFGVLFVLAAVLFCIYWFLTKERTANVQNTVGSIHYSEAMKVGQERSSALDNDSEVLRGLRTRLAENEKQIAAIRKENKELKEKIEVPIPSAENTESGKEPTPEEHELQRKERIERFHEQFESEMRDAVWASDTEKDLHLQFDSFHEQTKDVNVVINSVDCKSTKCMIRLNYNKRWDAAKMQERLQLRQVFKMKGEMHSLGYDSQSANPEQPLTQTIMLVYRR